MYDRGRASVTTCPARRPSAMSLRVRCALNRAPIRSASAAITMCPALCRVAAYSGPGLPRPTTIHRSSTAGPYTEAVAWLLSPGGLRGLNRSRNVGGLGGLGRDFRGRLDDVQHERLGVGNQGR